MLHIVRYWENCHTHLSVYLTSICLSVYVDGLQIILLKTKAFPFFCAFEASLNLMKAALTFLKRGTLVLLECGYI